MYWDFGEGKKRGRLATAVSSGPIFLKKEEIIYICIYIHAYKPTCCAQVSISHCWLTALGAGSLLLAGGQGRHVKKSLSSDSLALMPPNLSTGVSSECGGDQSLLSHSFLSHRFIKV